MDEIELVKVLLPEKVAEKAYDDLVSSPAKELGKVGVDVVKTRNKRVSGTIFRRVVART